MLLAHMHSRSDAGLRHASCKPPPNPLLHARAPAPALSYYAVVPLSLLPADWLLSVPALLSARLLRDPAACLAQARGAVATLGDRGPGVLALAAAVRFQGPLLHQSLLRAASLLYEGSQERVEQERVATCTLHVHAPSQSPTPAPASCTRALRVPASSSPPAASNSRRTWRWRSSRAGGRAAAKRPRTASPGVSGARCCVPGCWHASRRGGWLNFFTLAAVLQFSLPDDTQLKQGRFAPCS